MRIAIITSVFLPSTIAGGVTTVASDHAAELMARGHSVTILTTDVVSLHPVEYINKPEDNIAGIQILRFPAKILIPHFSLIFSFRLLQWLNSHADEFDIFHIHYGRELFSISVAELLLRKRKKVFLQTHGMLDRRGGLRNLIDLFFVKDQLKRARGVFALQTREANILKSISASARIKILFNGIRLSGLPAWSFDHNNHTKKVVFLSRLHPRKRVLDFIDAAKILIGTRHDLEFLIFGPDGGDRLLAETKIKSDDELNTHVKLMGAVDRKTGFEALAKADVFVLPALDEPFGMALIEALAIGVPSVVTNRFHLMDILNEYDSVEIVDSDPAALALGINKLLLDQKLSQERSIRGRQMVEDLFTLEQIGNNLELYFLEE